MARLNPGKTISPTRFVGVLTAAWIAGSVWSHATAEEAEPVLTAQIAEEGYERIVEASLLEGNIDAFNAQWKLTPIDGGARTQVEFKIYVDPDIPLPSSIFSRENQKAAGRTLQALRTRIFEMPQGTT